MTGTERVVYPLLNAVVRLVLRSPAHRLLSGSVLLLGFVGRKSGRRYSVPVGYVFEGEDVVCFTGKAWSGWWRNLAGGAQVVLRLRGRDLRCQAEVVTDEGAVARGLTAFMLEHPKTAERYGVSLDPEGRPDPEDVAAAARGGMAAVVIRARAGRSKVG